MMPTPESYQASTAVHVEATAADVARKLSTFLAGVPAETREVAIDAYRRITLEMLATRGMTSDRASPLVERIVADIRLRIAAIDRAGGTIAGHA